MSVYKAQLDGDKIQGQVYHDTKSSHIHHQPIKPIMFFFTVSLAIFAIISMTCSSVNASPQLMNKLVKQYTDNTKQHLSSLNGSCTAKKLVVREEWYGSYLYKSANTVESLIQIIGVLWTGKHAWNTSRRSNV